MIATAKQASIVKSDTVSLLSDNIRSKVLLRRVDSFTNLFKPDLRQKSKTQDEFDLQVNRMIPSQCEADYNHQC